MSSEISLMLKKVSFFNGVVGMGVTVISYLFLGNYAFVFLLGLIMAIVNFIINANVLNYSIKGIDGDKLILLFGFIFRVSLVCIIAYSLIKVNKYNIVPYVLGYSSQVIGLIIYGVVINRQ